MKIMIIIWMLFGQYGFAQNDFGWLIVNTTFESVKADDRIEGSITIASNTYPVRNDRKIALKSGVYQLNLNYRLNAPQWPKHQIVLEDISIELGDTTVINVELPDSLLVERSYLEFSDKKGRFFPDAEGRCIDEKGLKQGLHTSSGHYIGNCLNYGFTTYSIYKDGIPVFEITEYCDNNFCYKDEFPYSIRFKKLKGDRVLHYSYGMKNSSCTDIYLTIEKGYINQNHVSVNIDFYQLMEDNLPDSMGWDHPFVLDGEKLYGNYPIMKGGYVVDSAKFVAPLK